MITGFFGTNPVLYTTSLTLMISPCLLFFAFASIGRQERRNRLKSLFKNETAVKDLLSDATVNPEKPLGEFLQERYDEAHRLGRYVLPSPSFTFLICLVYIGHVSP